MAEAEDFTVCRQPKTRCKRDKYCKIPLKSKLIFYQKVIHQHGNLREVAEKLGIKYSTAKTLIRNYRFMEEEENQTMVQALVKDFETKSRPRKRCTYQLIDEGSDFISSNQRGESSRDQRPPAISKIEIVSSFLGFETK